MHEEAVKRDFALLSPREALRFAIVIEERNTQLYHRLGEMFSRFCPDSPQIVSAFYDLSNTERQHGILLTSRYCERFGAVDADITEEDIRSLVEVPRLCVGDILEAAEAGELVSARRMAFEMALATERNAVNYYVRLIETTDDPELKALYQELVTFEREHTDWVEQAINQLGHT
jgi:rubrerythrin